MLIMKWTPSQGLKVQITQLMNATIDCWHSFSGGNKANLAERSGVWKINIVWNKPAYADTRPLLETGNSAKSPKSEESFGHR